MSKYRGAGVLPLQVNAVAVSGIYRLKLHDTLKDTKQINLV